MKKLALGLLMGWLALHAGAAELKWETDLPAAQAQAKKEKKMVLMDFTGSDWCGWCIKLNKEVFSTKEFQDCLWRSPGIPWSRKPPCST